MISYIHMSAIFNPSFSVMNIEPKLSALTSIGKYIFISKFFMIFFIYMISLKISEISIYSDTDDYTTFSS